MKLILSIFNLAVVLGATISGTAQRRDVLGAHLNYGRGCSTCHISHSPSFRNRDDNTSGNAAWGEDVSSTYNIVYGDGHISGVRVESPEIRGVLICLSCHGGNYAPAAMMKNSTYEKLPYRFEDPDSIPTFTDRTGVNAGRELTEHPIGLRAQVRCGGIFAWDCTQMNGGLRVGDGTPSSRFQAHYGFFLKLHSYGNSSVAVCTTCHNPHSMNLTKVTSESASLAYPPGVYATKYFLRAPYGEGPPSHGSNQSAQFCRQCHADRSNELNGGTAGTVF